VIRISFYHVIVVLVLPAKERNLLQDSVKNQGGRSQRGLSIGVYLLERHVLRILACQNQNTLTIYPFHQLNRLTFKNVGIENILL
jgi:hypothetical protein